MKVLDLLLPASCCLCGALGRALCRPCEQLLPRASRGNVSHAPLRYDGTSRETIAAFKFRGHRLLAPILAALMAEQLLLAASTADLDGAIVTWAPTSPERARARGYDQAALLARALAAETHLPARSTLHRLTTTAQTGRPRHARLIGPRFGPTPRLLTTRDRGALRGRPVILVDDVATTGASLAAATLALDRLGVGRIMWSTAAVRETNERDP
ncbi:MAG: ComF family protein [Acidimicrobiia bacterium]